MSRAVFFSGLPKAGKSVTLAAIYDQLRRDGHSRFFLERLCPDCEGIWTAESGRQDLARGEKNALKERGQFFSPQFVTMKLCAICGLLRSFDLVLFDLGGIPSKENRAFAEAALAAGGEVIPLVLRREGQDASEWNEFWRALGLVPIQITSCLGGGGPFEDEVRRTAEAARRAAEL